MTELKSKSLSPLTRAILETADDMLAGGLIEPSAHQKITARHLNKGQAAIPLAQPITAQEIRAMREAASLSQAVFAKYLNLTTGYVSQLERGVKPPTGAALALLNVIRRRGIEAVL